MHIADQSGAPSAQRRPFYAQLYVQVLVAITVGILLGHYYPSIGESMKPLGDAFIKLVKMIIAPVIFLTVATGIAGMSDLQKVGRVAGKAMLYFLTFSTLALIIGLVSIALIAAAFILIPGIQGLFTRIDTAIDGATVPPLNG